MASVTVTGWLDEVRSRPVAEVATELGNPVGHRSDRRALPCPACREETRSASDKRPPARFSETGGGWACYRCGVKGSSLDYAAWFLLGRVPGPGDREGWAELRAELVTRGMVSEDGVSDPGRSVRPRPQRTPPPPRQEPPPPRRPPASEVAALWDASYPLTRTGMLSATDDNVTALLSRRDYWPPWTVDELDLVRVLPDPRIPFRLLTSTDASPPRAVTHDRTASRPPFYAAAPDPWPSWWPVSWSSTWRLVTRAYEPDGTLASLHARAVVDTDKGKTRWPLDYDAKGLLFADALGVRFLRGEAPETAEVIVVEGLTGVLWQSLSNRRQGRPMAVLGATSGAFGALAKVRWPPGVVVWAATDNDPPGTPPTKGGEAGERYATEIRAGVPASVRVKRVRFNRGVSDGG